ncbi:MAG: YfhO family protein [Lachnospiraceae bacterium]|nr:YfhO family protein [Lachnospiraceae bacterium]
MMEKEPLYYMEEKKRKRFPRLDDITIRPNDGLKIAFFIPMVIMVIIFIQRGIFPFGDESFLRTDMYHQYAPFFSEFQHKLRNGGSLLYSWDIGMGVNFAALYAYYLASPMNWLIMLCPKSLVIEFMTYMIVFKIGLSGLTFAWYLKKHCKTDSIGIGFFGIFYALSGYMAAYSWNIMWLDCILLFPLIMYGLEKLVREGNGFLYCITLGLSILSNYYISIMICIFMVLYFGALLILEKMDDWEDYTDACIRFAVYSLLSGAMAAVVLLPEIYALQSTASGDFNFPKTLTSYFTIFDMIARHLTCVETEIGLDHWPNIYCGVAVLMFFLLYVVCKKISVKERAVYCGLLLIFFASFSTNVLNFIWHGFHYPNSLPSRQSFIYIFLMLFVCFRAFMYLEETPKKHINAAFLGSICFVLLAEKLIDAKHFHFSIFYVAIIVLSMYAGVLHMFKIGKRELAACLALILVSVEAAANTAVTSVTITSREAYTRDNEDVHMLMDMVEPSDDFYRVEKKTRKTKNDGAWMNFPSVSLFSSTANADLTEFFKRMGCEASTNSYSITGSTPLVDSLVSIKYALYSEEVPNTELWAYMKESGETYLYENLYTLPLGFVISHSVEDNWQFKMDNPGEVQNDLCQALGNDAVLQWIDSNTSGKNCTFTPDLDGYYYVYVTNKKVKSVKAAVPSGSKTFNNTDRGYLLELGSLVAGNQITLTSQTDGQDMKCEVYRFSDEAMISLYEKLNKTPLKLTSWEDTKLAGTVNAAERGVLFTSIPYETGWTVKIDGEVTETEKIFEAFLSVDIPAGEHEITFEYFPAGLKPGIIITLASIAILAMLFIVDRIMERRYQEKKAARKAAEALEAMKVEAEDETDAMEFEEELPAEDETDSEVSDLEKEE